MPFVFVLLWSTGFIAAKYSMPYAEPMTVLFMRYGGVVVCMLPLMALWHAPWPRRGAQPVADAGAGASAMPGALDWRVIGHIAVAGLLMQAGYLGGVWSAARVGLPAGLLALIVGLQPILTVVFSSLMGERSSPRAWLGLFFGIAGVTLVVWNKLHVLGLPMIGVWLCVFALFSITVGTLYQKRFCPVFDLRTGSLIQFSVSALACLPPMFLFETREVHWTLPLAGALLWSILPLSIGATSLLFMMIRKGKATKVTSLMYLTPPTTALMSWALFGETFSLLAAAGMALAVLGTALVVGS
ncbi:MAG: DMT family transporter [Candidatus Protistobacter heckmanni]|nr:DMT family transporter [Candidatus Protistobacter heckmanni]